MTASSFTRRHGGARRRRQKVITAGLAAAALVLAIAVQYEGAGRAGADQASPYRGEGVYEPSGQGAWHGLYAGIPGVPSDRQAACTFPGGGEPDAFATGRGGTYALTGTRSSNGRSLTTAQLAFAFEQFSNDGNPADGEALDALTEENILGNTQAMSAAGQTSYSRIVSTARSYTPVTPTISGLIQSPAGRFNTTYSATVSGAPNTRYALAATGATLTAASVTTNSAGTGTFSYFVPTSTTTKTFTVTVAGTAYDRLDEYAATDQPPSQSQTVVTWGSTPVTSTARGSVEPLISASITKLTAGDVSKTPRAATFRVTDKTTGELLTTSFKTLAGKPTPLNGFTPGDTYTFVETKAPDGDYIPSSPFTFTIPATATDGFAIVLTDPRIPTVTIATAANYTSTPYGFGLHDTVTIAGDDGEAGHITGHPVWLPGISCAQATAAEWADTSLARTGATFALDFAGAPNNGNGSYDLTGDTPGPDQVGAWSWAETVTLSPSGATATSVPGSANECTDVTSPAAKTDISNPYVLKGDQITDAIDVTGLDQNPAAATPVGSIVSDLYAMPFSLTQDGTCPTPGTPEALAAWKNIVDNYRDVAQVAEQSWDVTGDAHLTSDPYTLRDPGCYAYQTVFKPRTVTLFRTSRAAPNASGDPIVLSPAGTAGEAATVISPVVTTTVAGSPTVKDATKLTFSDKATITDTHGVPTTLVDQLVGPVPPGADHTCATAQYSPNRIAGTFAPITVTTDQTVTTNSLTLQRETSPACYIGWESLTVPGPAGKPRVAYTATLGTEKSEMALITAAPPGKARSHGGGGITHSGGRIESGRADSTRGPAWKVQAGLALLVLAGAAALAGLIGLSRTRRRRSNT